MADVGCGPGYYSFRFARLIGDEGRVYAIETNPLHLDYLRDYVARYNVSNVDVIEGSFEGIGLPPHIKVDAVYICSLYHNVYAAFTDEEREQFSDLLACGFTDSFRYKYPEEVKYSWWSYRFQAREKNAGWRIDYFVISDRLRERLGDAKIHTDIFGSDHCPVELELNIEL